MSRALLLALALSGGRAAAQSSCVSNISQAGPNGSFCHAGNDVPAAQTPSATPSMAAQMGSGAAGMVGAMLGNALAAPTGVPAYQHVAPKPVAGDDDDLSPSPAMDGVDDIIKSYHPEPADDGSVRLDGTTPQLLRAAERPPVVTGDLSGIEDISLPADAPQEPFELPAVSLDALKGWAAQADDAGKAVIAKAAEWEQEFSDSAAGDAVAGAAAAKDTIELLNMGAPGSAVETGAAGQAVGAIGSASTGIRLVNACANGSGATCEGSAWGAGLSLTGGGTTMAIGMNLGKQGLNGVNQGSGQLNSGINSLQEGGITSGETFGTLPSQKKLNQESGGLFGAF